ncbi:MAG: aconitate hydratase AcnA [Armatimonadetes bacterium]|nr:aconitate hydratase AcnA [Armatimonadota bacterium]MDE2206919.1 aconitate hydratase AcnA [Armatimonadota bacterium]
MREPSMPNSFNALKELRVDDIHCKYFDLHALSAHGVRLSDLPFSQRILLENLLRNEDGVVITAEDVLALARREPTDRTQREIAFTPARVLLQDFTGVPCVVDLAAMRDAIRRLGGDPARINPLQPVELVIDHSVQVDAFGDGDAMAKNVEMEFRRNGERYAFLKWAQQSFHNFRVVPPSTGIVHQVNLEYLARLVFQSDQDGETLLYPDTVVGTDSHTTMVNGLGVLGWGVGGIEAEAAMLGQPMSMLIPDVVGVRLTSALAEGCTATDLVLTVTQILRSKGVVGKFVEFFGPGLASLPLADRATIGNMAPEYGATCGFFPADSVTLEYLRFTGRDRRNVAICEAFLKEQGLFHESDSPEAKYADVVNLDLGQIEPSIAGPRRPQDRIALAAAHTAWNEALPTLVPTSRPPSEGCAKATISVDGQNAEITDGVIAIAAITSCTNTSNPSVMIAAGLVARNAHQRGMTARPWVKTSLAPGSRVVTRYLDAAGLTEHLDAVGFDTVGYGCTTCIGNSGPLLPEVSRAVTEHGLVACSVLSGNRNFEGRIQSEVRANYLMSPPLVVAYALAGRMDIDLVVDPIGVDRSGANVYLRDLWPSQHEVRQVLDEALRSDMFVQNYAEVFRGDEHWNAIVAPKSSMFAWDKASTYVKCAPYFDDMLAEAPAEVPDIANARVLAMLGASITTDHISPAGSIRADSPAGQYLLEHAVPREMFNSYGSRRGNHEVMVRGTFANVRLRNLLAPGSEGGVTIYLPSGEMMSIYDASERYRAEGTPLVILAGAEYGSGSSRDWAAKGPHLQGVRAIIAESYERIHRSNLVGMGILPLQYTDGQTALSLGLTGHETISITGIGSAISGNAPTVQVEATLDGRAPARFETLMRIDTPRERDYYRHGGILLYVLRQLAQNPS